MAKKKTFNVSVLEAMTNAEFLAGVSEKAPEFSTLASEKAYDVFTEKGYQALRSISPDAETRFYEVALLVGAQQIDFFDIKNPLDDAGLIDRYAMGSGAYLQRTAVRRIPNVNPGWLGADGTGLKNGDSPDQYELRKPVLDQRYFRLNWNYQNWISLQDFDLKQGWITENGIGAITSAIFRMIELDRADTAFGKYFEVLSGVINSTEYPLRKSQVLELDSWTDTAPTDDEISSLITLVKDMAEALELMPTTSLYNTADYPNSASASDHVLLVRAGFKSRMERVMAYAFGPDYLQFPIRLKAVPNFGGLTPQTSDGVPLQRVNDKNGVCVGFVDAEVTINGYATQNAQGQWIVNVTSGGTASDTVAIDYADVTWLDNNADVIAAIIQKGAVFELMQNDMAVLPARNERGFYTNVWFNQPDNGTNFDYYKNIAIIRKPTA